MISKTGLNKQEFAKRVGVSQQSVYSWCAGAKMPQMKRIDILCRILGVERSELLENVGNNEIFNNFMSEEEKSIARKIYFNKEYQEVLNLYINLSTEKRNIALEILRNMK